LGKKESGGYGAMKVLYIGHYKEGTGWAKAAQGMINALDQADIEVVCRNITLTTDKEIPDRIIELEKNDTNNIDICIQHVLPHFLVGSNKFTKNIAIVELESTNIKENEWITNLRLMEEVWVPCKSNEESLRDAGIENVKVVPHAFDISKYNKETEDKLDFTKYGIDSSYKFYTIADINRRKNIESIIRTYYNTFYPYEDVSLILKVRKVGYDSRTLFSVVDKISSQVRSDMGIYENDSDYNNILVIADNFSEKEMDNLHMACDCFISMSHGEAWSIPAFDAMCYGNHPICTSWGGPDEYISKINSNTGTLINYTYSACSNAGAAFKHLFSGREYWAMPDEKQASEAMRYYFENRKSEKTKDGIIQGEKFSYSSIGKIIKETLKS
jgi:hypothetical protein